MVVMGRSENFYHRYYRRKIVLLLIIIDNFFFVEISCKISMKNFFLEPCLSYYVLDPTPNFYLNFIASPQIEFWGVNMAEASQV